MGETAVCERCRNARWLYNGEPHMGGDERCPMCNPHCRSCWDSMQIEIPWSDDLERGPRYAPCPNCAVAPTPVEGDE